MKLGIGKHSTSSNGNGIYVGEVTIVKCEDISNVQLPYREHPSDIGIRLTIDIGRSFQPEMDISGDFQKDGETVIGWGSAFRVRDFFQKIGWEGELTEDHHLPKEALEYAIGKKFIRLSYVSGKKPTGKLRYTNWSEIGAVTEGEQALANRFMESAKKGFPRNYKPDLIQQDDLSFPSVEGDMKI